MPCQVPVLFLSAPPEVCDTLPLPCKGPSTPSRATCACHPCNCLLLAAAAAAWTGAYAQGWYTAHIHATHQQTPTPTCP
jgi:hypothetical protein